MRDEAIRYRVVLLTLDSHAAGSCARASARLAGDFPGLELSIHAAAEWGEHPESLQRAIAAIGTADIVVTSLLFLDDHIRAIRPALVARRDACDAMIGIISDGQIVRLTRMGSLDLSAPAGNVAKLLKMLRGGKAKQDTDSGARKMKMLRRLPHLLKLIPGKAQDLRAWMVTMQYWLGASDENLEAMIRFLISRYSRHAAWRGARAPAPAE
jgi:magnesium chelatase subunit H